MHSVVIVTQNYDPHADTVVRRLHELGHEPFRLHTADFPLQASLGMRLGSISSGSDMNQWQGSLCLGEGRKLSLDTIHSVWWRRPAPFNLPSELSEEDKTFAQTELEHTLRGLWRSLPCYWVSHPEDIRNAAYKVEQLQRAQSFGFEIPRTLITTRPQDVQEFYELCDGNIIYKAVKQTMLPPKEDGEPSRVIYTTPITQEQLTMLEGVKVAPCLFQEYIPKAIELRVTVVGNDIFAAAIHSQENSATQTDWRHYNVSVPYRKATLPDEIAQRCLEYVNSYNLNYSALDLILTPDGRYVFLENNPNGQWGFIENAVPELKICDALVACLLEGKRV